MLCTFASMVMILFAIWFRRYVELLDRNKKLVDERWQEKLFEVVSNDDPSQEEGDPTGLDGDNKTAIRLADELDRQKHDELTTKDIPHFLYNWNYIHESLRGQAKDRLNLFAKKYSIEEKALKLLKSFLIKNRLIAINTLGNLGEVATYESVLEFARKKDPIVSVWAFRAMFRISPKTTMENYLDMIAERDDWSPAHVAKIIKECDVDLISGHLTAICAKYYSSQISEKQVAHLISYLRFVHTRDSAPLIEKILAESNEMEVLISCLRLIESVSACPRIRELLDDDRWQVRMFAIMALERFGVPEDIALIKLSLSDENWWVRYYAAQSLFTMPTMDRKKMEKLSVEVETKFEHDILVQVLAEDELICKNRTSTRL